MSTTDATRRRRVVNLTLIVLAEWTLVGLFMLTWAHTANADMRLGIQDDESFKYSPAIALARADRIDADWVRIMVPDNRWPHERDAYIQAAATAKANGKRVMASLLAWKSHPTPQQWAEYTQDTVAALAPYVDAWSPMNEPTWPGVAAWTATHCAITSAPSSAPFTKQRPRRARGWRKVRRGRGTHRRVVGKHRGRTVVKFKRAKTRRARQRARWRHRRGRRPASRIVYVTTQREQHQCTADSMTRAYRHVWDRVTPIIRTEDPAARLVVGDIYTDPVEFLDTFNGNDPPAVRPDVLGTHYSCACAIAGFAEHAHRNGLEHWESEWALKPDASPDEWVSTLRAFERGGTSVTFVYDTAGPTWDTRMRPAVLKVVSERP